MYCEELGAKLFEPSSLHIQNIILDIQNFPWYWLGISKTKGSEWRWLSNNSLTNWARKSAGSSSQNSNCIYVKGSGFWVKTKCESDKNYVICEKSTTLKSDVLVTFSNATDGLPLGIPPTSSISSNVVWLY